MAMANRFVTFLADIGNSYNVLYRAKKPKTEITATLHLTATCLYSLQAHLYRTQKFRLLTAGY